MLKKSLLRTGMVATTFLLVACSQNTTVESSKQMLGKTEQVSSVDNQQMISLDEAKKIAFEAAGVKEGDVKNLVVEEDVEMTKQLFEISFEANGQEYGYSIDKVTGKILERDVELSESTVSTTIDEQKAKEVALSEAGAKIDEVINLVVIQDHDNGLVVYEVEFVYAGQEYNYVIDSTTADIIEKEVELAN